MNNRKHVFQKERLGRFSACVSTLNPSPLCGRETAGNMALFFFLPASAVLLLASDADITVKFYTTDPASQSIKGHFPRIYGITASSHFSAAKPRARTFSYSFSLFFLLHWAGLISHQKYSLWGGNTSISEGSVLRTLAQTCDEK